jgi:mono/diheme cytochrome c family protein
MSSLPRVRKRAMRAGGVLFAMLVSITAVTVAQETQTKIKEVPPPATSAASGEKMYMSYCAACHGKDGKGDGPAAPALKGPVPDLTTLAQSNGGKYPADHVASVLRFGTGSTIAHGSKDMPIWGPLFSSMNNTEVLRINNLTHYLQTLQVK